MGWNRIPGLHVGITHTFFRILLVPKNIVCQCVQLFSVNHIRLRKIILDDLERKRANRNN